jgi:hypothetical protein
MMGGSVRSKDKQQNRTYTSTWPLLLNGRMDLGSRWGGGHVYRREEKVQLNI